MAGGSPRDLGEGVLLRHLGAGALEVFSASVDLGWVPRRGRLPGTAVLIDDELFEVVTQSPGGGQGWSLAPWPEGEAARHVTRLDCETVREAAAHQHGADQRRRRLMLALAVAPLLGLCPGALQARWERDWAFPAQGATMLSALLELTAAAMVFVRIVTSRMEGQPVFAGGFWSVAAALSPLLLGEGLVRLVWSWVSQRPMGSVLTAPLRLATPQSRPGAASARRGHAGQIAVRALGAALACLAPRAAQEEWGRLLDLSPAWFTICGGAAEVIGGAAEWAGDLQSGSIFIILDVFLVSEGLARLGRLALGLGPIGSVFGRWMNPLLARIAARADR